MNRGDLSQDDLHRLLTLDPETGHLYWKERDRSLFKRDKDHRGWNTRFAGKRAFYTDNSGYMTGAIFGKLYKAHRVIWKMKHGEWPNVIDHEHRVTADNTDRQIRNVDQATNMKNKSLYKSNKLGIPGVCFHKASNRYIAQIQANGRRVHLGCFQSPEAASEAYQAAKLTANYHENHGSFI